MLLCLLSPLSSLWSLTLLSSPFPISHPPASETCLILVTSSLVCIDDWKRDLREQWKDNRRSIYQCCQWSAVSAKWCTILTYSLLAITRVLTHHHIKHQKNGFYYSHKLSQPFSCSVLLQCTSESGIMYKGQWAWYDIYWTMKRKLCQQNLGDQPLYKRRFGKYCDIRTRSEVNYLFR